jgi:ATP-dependent exoDNAse (exonuclease V) alpha subunit
VLNQQIAKAYLAGSGMVKGIGPVYAKKLVGKFGEGIFDVIEQRSADLETVDGIGPKRRQKIKAAWAEQKVIRKIMVFLHSHGVSTSRSVRIYKTYGEEAVEKVQANPYSLARDNSLLIPSGGFRGLYLDGLSGHGLTSLPLLKTNNKVFASDYEPCRRP